MGEIISKDAWKMRYYFRISNQMFPQPTVVPLARLSSDTTRKGFRHYYLRVAMFCSDSIIVALISHSV